MREMISDQKIIQRLEYRGLIAARPSKWRYCQFRGLVLGFFVSIGCCSVDLQPSKLTSIRRPLGFIHNGDLIRREYKGIFK